MLVVWAVVVFTATAVHAVSLWSFLHVKSNDKTHGDTETQISLPDSQIFHEMFTALDDMQDAYFQRWIGIWPDGIDWTRAVMSTHVAATLRIISDELGVNRDSNSIDCAARKQDVIAGYFADIIAYYFGEDAFAIRNEAYDDMLWVVLGWLESIQFVDEHSRFLSGAVSMGLTPFPQAEPWYGSRWIPAFAHRARIFWELAAKGWDTKLCGGGMIWNPRLMPYKNAITNQLFISASVNMFLHFPGDANTSPFAAAPSFNSPPPLKPELRHYLQKQNKNHPPHQNQGPLSPHDPSFLHAAQQAHAWLTVSNMTNSQGLYADGFHISGYASGGNNTSCDERDEMVYTYNQGVILSGLLGLFQATGQETFLEEGHVLVRNVISATGWDLANNRPVDKIREGGGLPPWRGLGRLGVLEEACDAPGTCSQDAQTFKGIWMHHFAVFCSPAALGHVHPAAGLGEEAREMVRARHSGECARYVRWVRHNAEAAMRTRDGKRLFGGWWTAGLLEDSRAGWEEVLPLPENGGDGRGDGVVVDYRNEGVPMNEMWVKKVDLPHPPPSPVRDEGQKPLGGQAAGSKRSSLQNRSRKTKSKAADGDPNSRGRGRTVETQGGGLAVLRALWVVSRK
ncbi:hypothetical protein VTI74DRAFT_3322 [Chaetomium olivicolor]